MSSNQLTLTITPHKLAISQLPRKSDVPSWAINNLFYSITKTQDELSIICPEAYVPEDIKAERNWRAFKVEGPLGFTMVGVLASLAQPLADALIPIFAISTYQTDYILVEEHNLTRAMEVLEQYFVIQK